MSQDEHAGDWKCDNIWDAAVLIVCGFLAIVLIGGIVLVLK